MSIGWGIISLGCHATNKMAPAINAASDATLAAVYISSPNALHHQHTVQAATAGKHVLCEKPMADTNGAPNTLENLASLLLWQPRRAGAQPQCPVTP